MSNPNDIDYVVEESYPSATIADATATMTMTAAAAAAAAAAANVTSSSAAANVTSATSNVVGDDDEQKKALRAEILRAALPNCQPQEGSPANTFTDAELQELQAALPSEMGKLNLQQHQNQQNHQFQHKREDSTASSSSLSSASKKMDILEPWLPSPAASPVVTTVKKSPVLPPLAPPPPTSSSSSEESSSSLLLNWHGAPRFHATTTREPRAFREQHVRPGHFAGPTNGVCPGFLQCNLVVLPANTREAFDFLLFCQRNPQACPLLEVCTGIGKESTCPLALAPEADLRTDCPKYAVYRNGVLEKECTDVTDDWPEEAVAFLIGCSFSYDGALQNAGIPLRSAEQGKNVPMYKTNLACRPAGSLHGNMVVSMKPIPALQVAQHAAITARYTHAHGGPICIGRPDAIGVGDLDKPEWGDAVQMQPTDVPVFHACGVTPQAVLMASKVPFAITHAAGHMFVTDRPSDMGVV